MLVTWKLRLPKFTLTDAPQPHTAAVTPHPAPPPNSIADSCNLDLSSDLAEQAVERPL